MDNETVARVMQKLSNNNASFPSPIPNTSSRLVFRPTSSAHNGHEKDNGNSSTPLIVLSKAEDIGTSSLNKSESLKPKITHQSDVIMLDNEKYYAPDSVSPSPKPGFSRFYSQRASSDKENQSPSSSQLTPVFIQTLDFTPHSSARKSQTGSRGLRDSSSRLNSQAAVNHTHFPKPEFS